MSKEISQLHLKIKRKRQMRQGIVVSLPKIKRKPQMRQGIVVSLPKIKRKRQMRLNFSRLPQKIKRKSPYISHPEIIDITHL